MAANGSKGGIGRTGPALHGYLCVLFAVCSAMSLIFTVEAARMGEAGSGVMMAASSLAFALLSRRSMSKYGGTVEPPRHEPPAGTFDDQGATPPPPASDRRRD